MDSPENPFSFDPLRWNEELDRIGKFIYHNVEPAKKPEVQEELTTFMPVKERIQYPQDWHDYYLACRTEKTMFLRILKDAVDSMDLPYIYAGNGRPAAFFKDILKGLCIKAYSNLPSWRTEAELRLAQSMGVVDNVYRKTSINKYMNSPKTAEALQELFKIIAEPSTTVETNFKAQYATDATGVSNLYKNKKWVEVKLDKQEQKTFQKLHIICGTLTNVIIAARITEGTCHDSPVFEHLMKDASRFNIKEVSGDGGYLSRKNTEIISAAGATPYLMPSKQVRTTNIRESTAAWGKMIKLWKNHQALFAQHYHRRSNVESTFGSWKIKWGDFNRCKLPATQTNEILAKIVCHNARVLTEALLSYDIKPAFMST